MIALSKATFLTAAICLLPGCPSSSSGDRVEQGNGNSPTDDAAVNSTPDSATGAQPDGGSGGAVDSAVPGTDAQVKADGGTTNPGTDASTGTDLKTQVRAILDQCGVLAIDRKVDLGDLVDEFDRCTATCVVNGDCVGVRGAFCLNSSSTAMGPVVACSEKCSLEPADGFKCADGSRIPHAFVCDLNKDCSGGDDEKNCGTFTCDDDERLASREVKCDGVIDCGDESDESGCPLPACAKE